MSLWGGRFTGKVDPLMEAFNASINFDRRMWLADITASKAYAAALARSGIITAEEAETLRSGLDAVGKEWADGTFAIKQSDEDIHTANERRLGELVGSVAGKLHTGRSRNDQVATDFRLWTRDECRKILAMIKTLIGVVVERAETEIDVIMPGYTHLQRAQPIRWSHWLLSYAWSFAADAERLEQAIERLNKSPLGSGALAGNPFNIDRHQIAADLGFTSGIVPNSLLGVSDRDFVAEVLHCNTLTMVHLSRLAEDLIIYSTSEFSFTRLADAYSTGSSLMPQKKNPDSLELIRGKAGRVFGHLAGFLFTLKGLPSTYNKDLQEDKEGLFDSVDTVAGCVQICAGVLATLTIDREAMRRGLSCDMLATDLAEYLVRKKVPFRETHHIAGRAVKLAEDRNVPMSSLSLDELKSLHPAFEVDVVEVWNYDSSVEKRNTIGGTSRESVLAQIAQLKDLLSK